MSTFTVNPTRCPECDAELNANGICPECGFATHRDTEG